MRIPRIYHPEPLTSHSHIALCEDAANHIGRVLRMGPGQALQLFDGSNQVFDAEITSASKKSVEVKVLEGKIDDRESPLHIHLGQVMSRGEKMEFTIQKSIELGVSLITPLFSERCGVKLDSERLIKKLQQVGFGGGGGGGCRRLQLLPVSSVVVTGCRKSAQRWIWKPGVQSRMKD